LRQRQRRQVLWSRRNAQSTDLGDTRTTFEPLDVTKPIDKAIGWGVDVHNAEVREFPMDPRVETLDDSFARVKGPEIGGREPLLS
jgi:hypothetical protein